MFAGLVEDTLGGASSSSARWPRGESQVVSGKAGERG